MRPDYKSACLWVARTQHAACQPLLVTFVAEMFDVDISTVEGTVGDYRRYLQIIDHSWDGDEDIEEAASRHGIEHGSNEMNVFLKFVEWYHDQ